MRQKKTRKEKEIVENRRCTLKKKRDTEKGGTLNTLYHFLVARADEDRPVSVPVGNCCLELFDADCWGCI
jgi:hypothetical protein